ncbi:MAG: hypothetical protein ACI9HY_002493, partial [Planctomycetaceae bacterium]
GEQFQLVCPLIPYAINNAHAGSAWAFFCRKIPTI